MALGERVALVREDIAAPIILRMSGVLTPSQVADLMDIARIPSAEYEHLL